MREIGIDADRGDMWQIRVGGIKLIHFLYHGEDALLGVRRMERGELNRTQEEFLDVCVVVLRHLCGDQFLYFISYLILIDVEVILCESLVDLTAFHKALASLRLNVFCDFVFNNSHCSILMILI